MDFSLFPKVDEYRLGFDLRNSEYNIVFSTDLQVITLELPKFTVSLPQIQSPLDRWLYFFRYGHTIDTGNIPKELDTPEIREALEELKMLSHDDLERERYLARVRVLRDEKTLLLYAAESHDKGMEKGMEKGIQQGIQQGIQRGIEKGKAQLICVQLQKRFNSLDSNLQTQVETLDGDLLDALAGAIFEFKNVGDLREWLRREASAT
jgi:predicted transposase/invertase (TIGR01784 family)